MFPHEVTFEKLTRTDDGMGGITESWATHYTTKAHVQPISGYERIVAQQQQSPITTRVYFPYTDTTLKKEDVRILYGDKVLIPESDPIDQGGLGEFLLVQCYE